MLAKHFLSEKFKALVQTAQKESSKVLAAADSFDNDDGEESSDDDTNQNATEVNDQDENEEDPVDVHGEVHDDADDDKKAE